MSLKSTARDIDSPAAFAERASMLMKKRFLQAIYREWAERLAAGTTPGLTLEIGGAAIQSRRVFLQISALSD